MLAWLHKYAVVILRICLGVTFFWFGALKLLGVSPISQFIQEIYWFIPQPGFVMVLGVLEIVLGILLIFNLFLQTTIVVMILHLLGTFTVVFLQPLRMFDPYFPLLTLEGEFIMKNIVLISSGLVVLTHKT